MFQENVTVFIVAGMIKMFKIKESKIQFLPYLNIFSTLDYRQSFCSNEHIVAVG